ncbi:liver stage associated protein 1 [Plasmodium gonderi]|uniref:Liver stage associated protein 1 n=1 Tax=Plasmodium gonderi TaxID=77519 RepID=A0A1Y1JMC4_PLAGO|nr:liver stage associated protein 1 [Plasmodium gonderi]GAW82748.1 liver stage associated protein 1 [Plasmodium gonderi]
MKTVNILSIFILLLFSFIILPHSKVYASIPIDKLDFDTLKRNESIRAKTRRDALILLSVLCGSALISFATLWGIRLHRTYKYDQMMQHQDAEKFYRMRKSNMDFENEAFEKQGDTP